MWWWLIEAVVELKDGLDVALPGWGSLIAAGLWLTVGYVVWGTIQAAFGAGIGASKLNDKRGGDGE